MAIVPFKLDTSIDDGSLVTVEDFSLKLYKNYHRTTVWTPIVYMNHVMFYDDLENLEYLTHEMVRQNPKVGNFHYFNFTKSDSVRLTELDSGGSIEEHGTSLAKAIEIAFAACMGRAERCRQEGVVLPAGKKFDTLIFHLDDESLSALMQDEDLYEKFMGVLSDGATFRIPIFLVAEKVSDSWKKLLPYLEWIAFMGEYNSKFAKSYYSDLYPGFFTIGKAKLGICRNKYSGRLIILQSLKSDPSEWKTKYKKQKKEEQRVYDNFLREIRNAD